MPAYEGMQGGVSQGLMVCFLHNTTGELDPATGVPRAACAKQGAALGIDAGLEATVLPIHELYSSIRTGGCLAAQGRAGRRAQLRRVGHPPPRPPNVCSAVRLPCAHPGHGKKSRAALPGCSRGLNRPLTPTACTFTAH